MLRQEHGKSSCAPARSACSRTPRTSRPSLSSLAPPSDGLLLGSASRGDSEDVRDPRSEQGERGEGATPSRRDPCAAPPRRQSCSAARHVQGDTGQKTLPAREPEPHLVAVRAVPTDVASAAGRSVTVVLVGVEALRSAVGAAMMATASIEAARGCPGGRNCGEGDDEHEDEAGAHSFTIAPSGRAYKGRALLTRPYTATE